ncbi:ABC transporter substrate-binding protein [Deinococcus peraridilitoris]|uniref:Periplasmic glycine betaine/choline-binding (Lipo)protein of an ABC-type transport system (Osmoprotectant binding protein) n=1 Tax=Deinococcus peraridilitoris (strain DSM 19664 / LMG 22246 / CIP 109416 / KR-200) TaxID=937777 RepID=L0A9H7_DEIPD|nr:ABC transporter substrate-binding protein [Deinococcus peraridilitoris]AFZ69700.1 periplasmic glycine betaine/choline-binding (lipo)protein of an ABC-type transport system (osmoprotectant binding protein) [Deinococcus peraridilitoris DSM 19664]
MKLKHLLVLTALSAGTALAADPITVASKSATEGQLLGQMIILTLEDMGLKTVDKTALGDTGTSRRALTSGEVDIYPEYTGTALNVFFKDQKFDPSLAKNARKSYQTVKELDAKNGIVWLAPAPANNTWAVALPQKFASEHKIATLADFAKYVNGGGNVKVAGSPEFFNRPDSFPAFENAYGFQLKPDQKLILAGATTPQTQSAAANGTNGVNVAMAYGTDGSLAALKLVVLSDPKGAQPVYQPAPTVRAEVLKAHPEIRARLDKIFTKLDLKTLQDLNGQIAVEGKNARDVAQTYLKSNNLIK